MEAVSLEEWQNMERRVSRSTTKALVETRKRIESQWADNPKRRAALALAYVELHRRGVIQGGFRG